MELDDPLECDGTESKPISASVSAQSLSVEYMEDESVEGSLDRLLSRSDVVLSCCASTRSTPIPALFRSGNQSVVSLIWDDLAGVE